MAIPKKTSTKIKRSKKIAAAAPKRLKVLATKAKSIAPVVTKGRDVKKPGYLYAVGRRKTSVARVRGVVPGNGAIMINGLDIEKYLRQPDLINIVKSPLESISANLEYAKINFDVKVQGGGIHSQSEAIRHGIARLLVAKNKDVRLTLKQAGWLRRDAREKERKKPGLRRARRAPQWQKR